MAFAIHGNPGCEIWFRSFVELSKTGGIWELNEEGKQLKITHNEEDYHLLARRFSRYKRARTTALSEIRIGRNGRQEPDRFIEWRVVRKRVCEERTIRI